MKSVIKIYTVYTVELIEELIIGTPSYSNLISGIVTRLREDNRLDNIIEDDAIYYGNNMPQIIQWPAVTVALDEVTEEWRTFGGPNRGQKDAFVNVTINVFDQQLDYQTGLTSVESKVQKIEDVLRTDLGISGITYYSETATKRFAEVLFDNTPVFNAEIVLTGKIRFSQAG